MVGSAVTEPIPRPETCRKISVKEEEEEEDHFLAGILFCRYRKMDPFESFVPNLKLTLKGRIPILFYVGHFLRPRRRRCRRRCRRRPRRRRCPRRRRRRCRRLSISLLLRNIVVGRR